MAKKRSAKPKPFGQLLREKRIEKGYSLRKFAGLVGVSPTYLSQVEQMNVDPPTADRVKKMAEILGENVDEWTALAGRVRQAARPGHRPAGADRRHSRGVPEDRRRAA